MSPSLVQPLAASPAASLSSLPSAVAAAVWRADQLGHASRETLSSGFEDLDAALPGGGWSQQGVTELLCAKPGVLEWRLLGHVLQVVTGQGRSVALISPPHPPHAPGLQAAGLCTDALIWIDADAPADRLWATEQLVRARACGAILAWLPRVRAEQIRRLQVLAAQASGPLFVVRPQTAAHESSAAPLRLLARPGADWALLVDLLKRSGPPLGRTLVLTAVPSGLASCLPPRLLGRLPPSSTPSAQGVRFMDVPADVVVRPVAAHAPDAARPVSH